VLAGLVGAALARGLAASPAAHLAVFQHGSGADRWPNNEALTAEALAKAVRL
jgi:NAD(P)H-hydrate repair Nnr-like enzyme with NAD(P)H-hydrate dehydratase domain